MSDIIIIVFSSLGTIFALLAGIGLIRMPDTFLRISVNTKAATLGVGLLLGASAIYFGDYSHINPSFSYYYFYFFNSTNRWPSFG